MQKNEGAKIKVRGKRRNREEIAELVREFKVSGVNPA